MTNNTFQVKIFPAHFNDAPEGTIVSITYTHNLGTPLFAPRLSAMQGFVKAEFGNAVEGSNGTIVTNKVADKANLDGRYTVAAVHIPHGYESPKTIERVETVVQNLNLAFGHN